MKTLKLELADYLKRDGLNSQESGDLILFDYGMDIQSKFDWDYISINARGIVFDKVTSKLVARPFRKFWNYEELHGVAGERLPKEFQPNTSGPFRALEKMDGSCGICYFYNDDWQMNTRGSFQSDQAVWGKKHMDKHLYKQNMNPEKTYIFEIIYPDNRIVVDYDGKESLTLLGIIDNETGEEATYDEMKKAAKLINCEIAEMYTFEKFEDIFTAREKLTVNEEGYVVTFENGYKCKLKGEEYLKVHRILSSVTPLHFWRAIDVNTYKMDDIEETIKMLPDEFQEAARQLVEITMKLHNEIYDRVVELAKQVPTFKMDAAGRKSRFFWITNRFKDRDKGYASDILMYLDNKHKKLRKAIHRRCRPTHNSFEKMNVDKGMMKRLTRILGSGS